MSLELTAKIQKWLQEVWCTDYLGLDFSTKFFLGCFLGIVLAVYVIHKNSGTKQTVIQIAPVLFLIVGLVFPILFYAGLLLAVTNTLGDNSK